MTKNEQRCAAMAARATMSPEQRKEASELICRRLWQLPQVRQAGTVLGYRALHEEVDLSVLHELLRGQGTHLCFPVSLEGGVMEAWEPGDWKQGRYGIWEPDRDTSLPVAPGEINLVLAPCVGFDQNGNRLGHGAGYYDRYLPHCAAPVIAVAFEAQKLEKVETELHDRMMDAVVTEKTVYTKKA